MKKMILIAFVALFSVTTFAQTAKVGTINRELIISKMPELKLAQDALKEYNQDLEKQLADKLANYDKVYKAAEAGFAAMTDAEKLAKQEELAGLESDITKFRNNGTQLVQLKQNELLNPLYDKISKALDEIASAEGYSQVLSIGNGSSVIFAAPSFDLTIKVMQKLGITVD